LYFCGCVTQQMGKRVLTSSTQIPWLGLYTKAVLGWRSQIAVCQAKSYSTVIRTSNTLLDYHTAVRERVAVGSLCPEAGRLNSNRLCRLSQRRSELGMILLRSITHIHMHIRKQYCRNDLAFCTGNKRWTSHQCHFTATAI
jgi:hypothetical protein